MKLEVIKNRKSIRTYDGNGLSESELNKVNELINNVDNPFKETVKFKLLSCKDHDISSPVIVNEDYYLISIVKKDENYHLALGYVFEDLVLKFEEMGLSTVILGGTYKKENFKIAAKINDDEDIVLVSPLGHKASKMSIRETLMRNSIGADKRIAFNELFFKDDFKHPLNEDSEFALCLNAVRYAPSAVNKQPWRIMINDMGAHFYKKGNKGYEAMQLIDMGIALRHFTIMCDLDGEIKYAKPDIDYDDLEYIISYCFK